MSGLLKETMQVLLIKIKYCINFLIIDVNISTDNTSQRTILVLMDLEFYLLQKSRCTLNFSTGPTATFPPQGGVGDGELTHCPFRHVTKKHRFTHLMQNTETVHMRINKNKSCSKPTGAFLYSAHSGSIVIAGITSTLSNGFG